MIFRRSWPPIWPKADGRFGFALPQETCDLIVELGSQLGGVLGQDSPVLRRLFPTAYPDDPDRDAGYQVFARGELIERRQDAVATITATADRDDLEASELNAWMWVVNDLRLVLGTQLDIQEGDDPEVRDDDPAAHLIEVYHVLGAVLEVIVGALSSALPDTDDDEDQNPGV